MSKKDITQFTRRELREICNIYNKNLTYEIKQLDYDDNIKKQLKEIRFIDLKLLISKNDILDKIISLKELFDEYDLSNIITTNTPLESQDLLQQFPESL